MAGISVRDENSFNIVSHLLGKDPVRVCDPVLLYGYERERARFKKIERSPYLLIYAYDNRMNDKKEVDAIKAYARANHLELVSPGFIIRGVITMSTLIQLNSSIICMCNRNYN